MNRKKPIPAGRVFAGHVDPRTTTYVPSEDPVFGREFCIAGSASDTGCPFILNIANCTSLYPMTDHEHRLFARYRRCDPIPRATARGVRHGRGGETHELVHARLH